MLVSQCHQMCYLSDLNTLKDQEQVRNHQSIQWLEDLLPRILQDRFLECDQDMQLYIWTQLLNLI